MIRLKSDKDENMINIKTTDSTIGYKTETKYEIEGDFIEFLDTKLGTRSWYDIPEIYNIHGYKGIITSYEFASNGEINNKLLVQDAARKTKTIITEYQLG